MSLRLKATLAAIALGTLPVLAIGGFAYSVVDRQIRDNAIKEQETLTQTQGKRVSAFMFERYGDIQILANLGILTNSKLRKEVSPADKEKTLTKFVETYEVYDAIAAFDLNGDVIGQSSGVKEKNHKKANFFQEVLKTGKPTIFQPGLSKATGKITIIFAAPIIDKDTGKIIGVVRSKMPVKYIARVMGIEYDRAQESSEFQGKEVENHLIDANNKVFVASEETQNLNEEITKAIPGLAALKASHKLGSIEGFDTSTPDPLLISYAPIEPYLSLPDLGWSVVVHQDKAIVFAASNRILTIIGIGTALSAAVISIIATIIANRAINPILEASKAVQKLGQGELKTRLTVRGTDELAILGVNINVMAEQLETSSEAQQRYTEKLMLQNDTLSNLARHEGVLQGNAKLAAKEFTETIARILQVARTSIWLYNPSRNGFVCFDSYEDKSKQHSEGLEFAAIDYPDYFQAIEQDRPIVAVDAHNDPATHEFSENYLKPLEITSKLDIPVRSAGMVGGVICCEQIGEQRNWDGDEIVFVSSIANLFSLTLENDRLQEEIIHLLDTVSEVEDGNFITRAKVSDRATGLVSDTFNRLLENLGQVLAQTLATARQVSSNAVELEQLSNKVVETAEKQAKEASHVLNLTEQVQHSAQNSTTVVNLNNQSLTNVRSTVEQGQDAVSKMSLGITILQQGTDRIIQQMKTLGEFVGLADQFVQEQSQIAYLTQVLAVNATLVAARASEQKDPRYFGTVAREFEGIAAQVSSLAQQTNDGLLTLQQRTEQIHSVVSTIDVEVQGLGGLVTGFTDNVNQSHNIFDNMQSVTGQVVETSEAVAQSSQQIVDAAKSTAKVMRDITLLAARTAKLTKKTQRKSEGMEVLSTRLLDKFNFFRLPEELVTNSLVEEIDDEDDMESTIFYDAQPDNFDFNAHENKHDVDEIDVTSAFPHK
ncbi:MAG: GAF domain-containing protein [Xenococcaceae cyanobacterium]